MEPIVIIEGEALARFMGQLQWLVDMYERGALQRVRVAFDEDAVKVKGNDHSWSLPAGELDPRSGK